MGKYFLLAIGLLLSCFYTDAQGTNRYAPSSSYYSPVVWGVNGFRTVEEEDRLMAQTLEEVKRQRQRDEMTPEEIAAEKRRREDEQAEKRKRFGAANKAASATKKK